MSRRTEGAQREDAEVAERLKAERIQESLKAERIQEALKAERIQEALANGRDTVFRETFLLHLPPGADAGLRLVGRAMAGAVLAPDLPGGPAPGVSARVRAVAEDLRASAQVLAALAEAREERGLTPEDLALALKAESWAREVAELVRALEGAAAGSGGPE